jgi:hypothetical protein
MKSRLALLLPLLLSACGGSSDILMSGYIDVPEPGGKIQKVHMACQHVYDPDSRTISITGVTLPVTSVVKPQLGGISMTSTAPAVTDEIRALDLQQIALCESLILAPDQASIRQAFKDYIGVGGYLTEQIRTLNSSTTPEQYQNAVSDVLSKPATVAPSTATAVQDVTAANSAVASLQAPPLKTFPTEPSLTTPPAGSSASAALERSPSGS